ncbi:hypothetical protein BJY24_005703 [Nocardia transvalensis]|uniref:Uncharacterized protein n=1 Tax=Nocardia transvalensis TaxID=37333 RepID=A0A7W9PIL4_9NOCA|nr:hypothetical protein [Nocardia transvalensis]MBB5916791.1 hypothetical protein [Nocardia transvalensis]
MTGGGVVVHHYNRQGRARDYDFGMLPVAEPMQRSLAALFAARCVPHRWAVHKTSKDHWLCLVAFARFVSGQQHPPRDLTGLTAALVRQWRDHALRTSGHSSASMVISLLRDDPRLRSGSVADELCRRMKQPDSTVQSYCAAEFDQIIRQARRMFRAALRRIDRHAGHLQRWRDGSLAVGSVEWTVGEALDALARTGSLPRYTGKDGQTSLVWRHRRALVSMFGTQQQCYLLLFLSRMEAAALGVLLMAEYGWNLSVISEAAVPRALPDQGTDGHPTYRIPLEKRRRGAGAHFETRNVTDDGAGSRGRLITDALRATRFARAVVESLEPGTDRLIIWRGSQCGRRRCDPDCRLPVGPFDFGVHQAMATEWGQQAGAGGSPFRRGRRTIVALDRREPTQHSQDTHDRRYLLVDRRVRAESVEIIAAGAEDAARRARAGVLVADLRAAPTPGDLPTATADCSGVEHSPRPTADGGCGASFLLCLACPNARIHPGHHPRLAHLHQALTNLRSVLPPTVWGSRWADSHARLEDLKHTLGEGLWTQALTLVGDDDRTLIHQLLTGDLDT